MDEELREAAADASVRRALDAKVSRERIGAEIDLMFRCDDPVCAMRLIILLNLATTVFQIDDHSNPDTTVVISGTSAWVDEQLQIGFKQGLDVLDEGELLVLRCGSRFAHRLTCPLLLIRFSAHHLERQDSCQTRIRGSWFFVKKLLDRVD